MFNIKNINNDKVYILKPQNCEIFQCIILLGSALFVLIDITALWWNVVLRNKRAIGENVVMKLKGELGKKGNFEIKSAGLK